MAGRVLQFVGNRAEAAVTVTHTRQGLTRFANSFVHQNVVDEHVEVSLQLSAAGRPASAVTYSSDDASLHALVDRALYASSLRPLDQGWPGLSPAIPLIGLADVHNDVATAAAGPDQRASTVAAFVAASRGLSSAGYCETRDRRVFLRQHRGPDASLVDLRARGSMPSAGATGAMARHQRIPRGWPTSMVARWVTRLQTARCGASTPGNFHRALTKWYSSRAAWRT